MKRPLRLEVFQGEDGQWYVRLRWPNGRIYMVSEGYARKTTALRLARQFMRLTAAPIALRLLA